MGRQDFPAQASAPPRPPFPDQLIRTHLAHPNSIDSRQVSHLGCLPSLDPTDRAPQPS